MKAYTDLEQSRKLAEILPIESADYHYIAQGQESYFYPYSLSIDIVEQYNGDIKYIPCWSLAALMGVLPKKLHIVLAINEPMGFAIGSVDTDEYDCVALDSVDACCELILKLKELKML